MILSKKVSICGLTSAPLIVTGLPFAVFLLPEQFPHEIAHSLADSSLGQHPLSYSFGGRSTNV